MGMGRNFVGCYDILQDRLLLTERSKGETIDDDVPVKTWTTRSLTNLPATRSLNSGKKLKWRAAFV